MKLNSMLREHWNTNGIYPSGGTNAVEIAAFEAQHDIVIPADLRDFLLEFNGTLDMSGTDYFRFLQLEDFTSSDRHPVMSFGEAFAAKHPSIPNGFYVFADYLQWCYGYAIQLGKGVERNDVVLIGGLTTPVVANSFTEFMSLYMMDSSDIHPKVVS